jgi:hypothetical protein
MTWKDRRAKIREQYIQNLTSGTEAETATPPKTIGSAPFADAIAVGHSASVATSASRSSAMSATGTDLLEIPPDPLESSTPVRSTSDSSAPSTAWMVSPLGFTENNLKQSIVGPNGSLLPGLPSAVRASLEALAIGRSEPIEEVIYQIAMFFVDAEDERAEGSLVDCLSFYVANYCGASV